MDGSTAVVVSIAIICATIMLVNFYSPNTDDKDFQDELIQAEADKEATEKVLEEYKELYKAMKSEVERQQKIICPEQVKVEVKS